MMPRKKSEIEESTIAEQGATEAPAEDSGSGEQVNTAEAVPTDKPKRTSARKPKSTPEAAPAPAADSDVRSRRKVRQGRVVSDKMTQTIVVAIDTAFRHPIYGKTIRRTTK